MKSLRAPKLAKKLLILAAVAGAALTLVVFGPFGSPALAAQFGRPIADITTAAFTPTPIWSNLNETTANGDTTAVSVANNGTTQTPEVLLGAVVDPVSAAGHIMSINAKTTSNRNSTVTLFLYQGATLIATSTAFSLTTSYAQYDYTLTSTEANSISDYSNLRIRVTFNDTGGGNPGLWKYTWAQLQVPAQPNIIQFGYRWRSDDGNETTGTSLAAENTAASVFQNTTVRLRVSINNPGGDQLISFRPEYATAVAGVCTNTGWNPVPVTATTEPFNMATSANYTDQAASTNAASGPGVLTDPGGGATFSAGKLVKNPSNTATSVTIAEAKFTELEFAIQANSNASQNQYCFRLTNAGTPLTTYSQFALLTVQYPPAAPVIYNVKNAATNVSVTPTFQLRSLDLNSDYLQYVIELCLANSFPCSSGAITYNETNTCWSGQDAQSGTAYLSNFLEYNSTMAACAVPIVPTSGMLAHNTIYYMRAKAIDPGGSNTYSPYSSVNSFTTSTLEVLITGGTNIGSNTKIGN